MHVSSLHPRQPSLRARPPIPGGASMRAPWNVHLIPTLSISKTSLNVLLKKNPGGCSRPDAPRSSYVRVWLQGAHQTGFSPPCPESIFAAPMRQRWNVRLAEVAWHFQVHTARGGWELAAFPELQSSCSPPLAHPHPHLETCVRDKHIVTRRSFLFRAAKPSIRPTGHLAQAAQYAAEGTRAPCALGSSVYQEDSVSP